MQLCTWEGVSWIKEISWFSAEILKVRLLHVMLKILAVSLAIVFVLQQCF